MPRRVIGVTLPPKTQNNPNELRPGRGAAKLAEAVRSASIDAALQAYDDARIRGLCREGAWEAAIGAIRTADVANPIDTSSRSRESAS